MGDCDDTAKPDSAIGDGVEIGNAVAVAHGIPHPLTTLAATNPEVVATIADEARVVNDWN